MDIVKRRLLPFFIFFILLLPLIFLPKIEIMQVVNKGRTPFLDLFFTKASTLGNALSVAFLVLLVLRFKLKWLAVFIVAFLTQVILVLLFKKGFYAGELRPYLFFYRSGLMETINLVEGVKIRYVNTFPSGHTATIFFLVSFFALLARNKVASCTLLIVGLLVGFSRIYLFQHWYTDVYFGMLFGTFSSIVGYLIVRRFPKKWHTKQLTVNWQGLARSTQNVFRQLF